MTFLWTSPFGPVALLAIGGLLLVFLDRRQQPGRITWVASALAGLAWLAWLLLRLQPGREPYLWLWSPPLSLPATLQFQLQGWSWFAGLCVTLAAFVTLSLPGWRARAGFTSARSWTLVLAALTLLVLLAGNWLTLLSVWVGMVLLAGLVAGGAGRASMRVWSYGVFASLFLLAAPLFNSGRSLESGLGNLALNAQAQFLVILAVAITLAAYPFHLWLVSPAGREHDEAPAVGQQLASYLLPALAALFLLGLFSLPLLATQAWAPLAAVALLGSALAAWSEREERRAWLFVLANRGAWALLVVGLAQADSPQVALFTLLSFGLGALLWVIGGIERQASGRNWPLWLGAVVFYGLPLTPGFIPNLGLADLAGTWIAVPGWLVLLLAQSLFVAALFLHPVRLPALRSPADPSPRFSVVAFVVCAAFILWYALASRSLAALVGAVPAAESDPDSFRLADVAVVEWITVLVPLGLGILLARADQRWFGSWRQGQRNTAFLAGLDWLAAGVGRASHLVRVGLSFVSDLVDGAGQFGWVILVLLVAWLLLRG